jgi:hypothetical protein
MSKKYIAIIGFVSFILGFTVNLTAFAAGPATIDLLSITTNNFVILGQTAITDANPTLTSVTGNVGLSSAAGSNITGLSCTEVTGNIYDVDGTYTGGHDSNISCLQAGPGANKTLVDNAVLDMGTAYVNGNTRTAATGAELNIGGGTLNGQNFVPGLYTWTSNVTITGDITLTGSASDVWIFQVTGTLNLATSKQIILAGGAVNSNIFWVVTGATTLFPDSVFRGNILDQTSIAMQLGAVLEGRALAQTAVTLIGSNVSTANTSLDTTPPVITLVGTTPITKEFGSTYTDAGATALDDVDGVITSSIVTVNPVNTSILGVYVVTYNVSDAAGNPAVQVTRTVNVVDTTLPVITRLGLNPASVVVSNVYTDAGATALDNVDGNITASIVTVNPVNTAVIGAYTVTYNVTDSSGNVAVQRTRTVNVIATADTVPPVITVVGSSPVSLTVGGTYTDSGATASDDIDGDITDNIVTINPVDENVVGTYTVTYNVSDSSGNAATQKTRTVNVVARASSGSSGGGTHYGCKDPNATNYEYFAASKPSLCVYTTASIPMAQITTSTSYIAPLFPNSGFAPESKTMFWGLVALSTILTVIISSFVILAKRSKV